MFTRFWNFVFVVNLVASLWYTAGYVSNRGYPSNPHHYFLPFSGNFLPRQACWTSYTVERCKILGISQRYPHSDFTWWPDQPATSTLFTGWRLQQQVGALLETCGLANRRSFSCSFMLTCKFVWVFLGNSVTYELKNNFFAKILCSFAQIVDRHFYYQQSIKCLKIFLILD